MLCWNEIWLYWVASNSRPYFSVSERRKENQLGSKWNNMLRKSFSGCFITDEWILPLNCWSHHSMRRALITNINSGAAEFTSVTVWEQTSWNVTAELAPSAWMKPLFMFDAIWSNPLPAWVPQRCGLILFSHRVQHLSSFITNDSVHLPPSVLFPVSRSSLLSDRRGVLRNGDEMFYWSSEVSTTFSVWFNHTSEISPAFPFQSPAFVHISPP